MKKRGDKLTCRKPGAWLYGILYLIAYIVLGLLFRLRFSRDPAVRRLKGPILVLSNHPSYIDPALMAIAVWPHRVHFLTSNTFFRLPLVRPLLRKIEAIPKTQFRSDAHALKRMLQIIRCNSVLGIYPEGQRSLDGSLQPIDAAIGKLIKKISCNVVLVREMGAYLSWPRWSKSLMRYGRIEITSKLLFTPEKIARLSIEEIQNELLAELHYNDYDWQRKERHICLSAAPARGLHQFCHRCPGCQRNLAMKSSRFSLYCRYCGQSWKMDRFGMLHPARKKNIRAQDLTSPAAIPVNEGDIAEVQLLPDPWHWHRWQIKAMAVAYQDPQYVLTVPSSVYQVDKAGTAGYLGHGKLHLSRRGLSVQPDPGESAMHIDLPVINRTGIIAKYGEKFEINLEDKGYRFFPDDGQSVIMIVDAIQAMQGLAKEDYC